MKSTMSNQLLNSVINHIRNRTYMSGVERDRARIKATGEIFTPGQLVNEILNQVPIEIFLIPGKRCLDNSCGDGQFLGEILIRKIENGSTFEQALGSVYGVDLMPDNVEECRKRLLCGREDLRHIVEQNIVCADALKYHYRFDGTPCDPDPPPKSKKQKPRPDQEVLNTLTYTETCVV